MNRLAFLLYIIRKLLPIPAYSCLFGIFLSNAENRFRTPWKVPELHDFLKKIEKFCIFFEKGGCGNWNHVL